MTVDVARAGGLRLRGHLRLERDGDAVLVVGEDGITVLRGRAAAVVGALVDGDRTVPALDADPEEVAVLERLRSCGLVEVRSDAPAERPRAELSTFHGATSGARVDAAPSPVVEVLDLGDPETAPAVSAALDGIGARPATASERVDVTVVTVSDLLDPGLAELDAQFRAEGRPWLPVRARGVRQWIGPFFGTTPDGPCWTCLADRLRMHRRAEQAVLDRRGESRPLARALPAHPATLGYTAHAVAFEVDAWAHGLDRPVRRAVVVHDSRTMTSERHELRRRPQCPTCGDTGIVTRRANRQVRLGPTPGDAPPGRGLPAALGHLVSPVTGVVPALEVTPGPVAETFIARTGPLPSPRRISMDAVRRRARLGCGGAGSSPEAARTSGLGEALERWCGQWFGDEQHVRARRNDLGDAAVDPRDCLLLDPRQIGDRDRWNAEHGVFNQVAPAVDDEEVTSWTPMWSLRDGRRRLLPTGMLHHGAPGPLWAPADSNGCAAGPTRDEAIRRGLLELVERDAVALWWYNRTPMRGLDLDGDAGTRAVRERHRSLGRDLWALDLTSDLGIPVVVALSGRRRPDGAADRVMLGFGADPDPAVALRRALGELASSIPLVLDGAVVSQDLDVRRWIDEVDTAGEPWLRPSPGPAVPVTDLLGGGTVDPAGGVSAVVARLCAHGLDPLVLDQTRPDVGLPVVRTVVPTLRPMWARFAPGRLFDVPVELGRRAEPLPYESLNPRVVFL
ncbi:TOMM precursor leader peptide-binding protein [Actinomycetospora atypica]|uniref:TOMM leader peptide-binding protein n=1 Tax=Actinomycetospora atypica TaxID=1290095 RepID=A0ABV9YRT3_9PSEU